MPQQACTALHIFRHVQPDHGSAVPQSCGGQAGLSGPARRPKSGAQAHGPQEAGHCEAAGTGLTFSAGDRMAYTLSSQPMAKPAGGTSARRLRLATFVAIAAFMVVGPLAEQVFGLRSSYIR